MKLSLCAIIWSHSRRVKRLNVFFILVTPLDVVKIRMQAQTKGFVKGQCFLYCNGLMDHVCTCLNGNGTIGSQGRLWQRLPNEQISGMLVSHNNDSYTNGMYNVLISIRELLFTFKYVGDQT